MPAIFFADLDALRLALASGAVPPAVGRAPARAGYDAQGRLWLQPAAPLARESAAALTRLGAAVQGTSGADLTEEVACWPQLLPLQPAPPEPDGSPASAVLFDLIDTAQLAALVAELRRLGAGRAGVRWITPSSDAPADPVSPAGEMGAVTSRPRALLLVESPPFFSLLRALDRGPASPRAYARQAPRVWVEVGFRHPLADQIEPPEGQVALLAAPRAWEYLDDGPFRTGPDQFPLPRRPAGGSRRPDDLRLKLPLRLTRATDDEPAELWVIGDRPLDRLRALAEQSDDRLLARLAFALGEIDGQPVAVLRVRPGKGGPPVLVLDALACRPYLRLPNLFVAVGQRLRPPVRRDAVRRLLASDAGRVTWLEPIGGGEFAVRALPTSAFHPLEDIIAYRVDHEPEMLRPEAAPPAFALPSFTVQDLRPLPGRRRSKPPAAPPAPAPEPAAADDAHPWWHRLVGWFTARRRTDAEAPTSAPARPAREPATPAPDTASAAAEPRSPDAQDERRRALEARFLAVAATPDAADRQALWPELANLYADLSRPADAAVCWLNALWEQDDAPAPGARGWLRAETRTARRSATEADLQRWLAGPPSAAAVRAVAAYTVWAATQDTPPAALTNALDRVQRLLEDHDAWLPVRAVWLVRVALHRLTRGDIVGLARARDRLLERLHERGLSADLDVPTFLRFAGQASGERLETVRDWLLHSREPIHRWITARPARTDLGGFPGTELTTSHDPRLQRVGFGTDLRATRAYADLILAWGLARLGERAVCQDLLTQARTVLANSDEVHGFLLEAFAYRVRQALEGRGEAGPLPPELRARLDGLKRQEEADKQKKDQRLSYTAEKLQHYSRILEPLETVDPYHGSVLIGHVDDLQRSLGDLRRVHDRDELSHRLSLLLATTGRDPDRLPRVLEVALDKAPRLGEAFAVGLLDRLLATVNGFNFSGRPEQVGTQVGVLERGLLVAAHFDQAEAVQRLVGHLGRVFDPRRGDEGLSGNARAEDALLSLIGQGLRGLRRLGLRAEADLLLERLGEWLAPGGDLDAAKRRRLQDWPKTVRRLLVLAGGWFYVGRDALATAALDEARLLLFANELKEQQTAMACAYAAALGHAPVRLALGRVEELFQRLQGVTDNQSTNTHYSLARLRLVEAAVLAVVNDDFALGPTVRRWLDDDEYRVRRRIHRDTRALVGPGA